MQMKSSKVMGSVSAPAATQAADKFGSIGARLEREALGTVGAAIKASGGSNPEVKASAKLKNVLEGTLGLTATWFTGSKRVVAKADLPISSGNLVLDVKAFLASAEDTVHESPTEKQKTYQVDPALLKAKRLGELVVLSHPHLPQWSLNVSVAEVKASREAVEERIANSIQGFCAGQLYRNADLMAGVKMPIVASEAPAQVVRANDWVVNVGNIGQISAGSEEEARKVYADYVEQSKSGVGRASGETVDLLHDGEPVETYVGSNVEAKQQQMTASSQTVKESRGKATVTASASAQWEASEAVKGSVRRSATAAALAFVGKQIQGGSPSIKEIDLSGMNFKASGMDGSAIVSVEYYGKISREQMTVAVPFDNAGRVVASGVGRTQADLLASEEIRRQLEIASEQDAKALFDKFVAEETAKAGREEAIGINASSDMGYGANWIKRGPADRIPIEKNALPAEFSVVGKKILLGGLVYEVQVTDYNAPSIERSAHWMLELRAEIPASKADFAYSSNGLGQALSTVGL